MPKFTDENINVTNNVTYVVGLVVVLSLLNMTNRIGSKKLKKCYILDIFISNTNTRLA